VINAVLLPSTLPDDFMWNSSLQVQVVAIDAVEAASVEGASCYESVEVVSDQDVSVGEENPQPPRSSQSNVFRIELRRWLVKVEKHLRNRKT
jgi:hypothetical protein